MTKEEFIAAAVRFGVVDSNAIDDAEEYDNSETYTALCSLYDFALAEPNALDAQGPRADCSPPDMPTAAAPAGLSAESKCERVAREPTNEPYIIPAAFPDRPDLDPALIHQIPVTVTDPDGNSQTVPWSLVVTDEPTREPSAIQRVCHALTGGCVMITDPERAACTSENCLAMRAAENRGGKQE